MYPAAPMNQPNGLRALASLLASSLLLGACGDSSSTAKPDGSAAPSSTPAASNGAKPAEPTKPKGMPAVTVDNLGPYIDGQRPDLGTPEGPKKLTDIVKGLPIDGKEVTLVVLKKSKTRDVLAVVRELGAAGAPTVRIKTDGRNDLPQELVVTPSNKLSATPPACSVVTTLGEDLSTRVWSVKGGTAKLQKKGFAGPDYTLTADAAKKDIDHCASDTGLFSGDEKVDWELTFNLGGALSSLADPGKKLKNLVLVVDSPVAGRPLKVP